MDKEKTDCLSCKLVTSTVAFGVSAYLFYEARGKRSNLSKAAVAALGIGFGLMGFARLINYRPFSNHESQEE